MAKLVLIDGHSLLHRAFFALRMFTTSGGEPTNAVYGFALMLLNLLEHEEPEYAAVAFDLSGPTFRHQQFAAYKGHRPAMPDQLRPQVARIRQLIRSMRIPIFTAEGFEADDVIGTLSRQAEAQGCSVLIVSGDRDLLQLVTPQVSARISRKGVTDTELFTPETVKAALGLTPGQVVDFKGLVGDPSDNIPGVPGIGEKTARELLQRYGNLEGVLAHLEELRPTQRSKLEGFANQALVSRELATIRTDAPVELDLESCRLREPDLPELYRLFTELEFRSLLERLMKRYPQLGELARAQAPVAAAAGAAAESRGGTAVAAEEKRGSTHLAAGPEAAQEAARSAGKAGPAAETEGAAPPEAPEGEAGAVFRPLASAVLPSPRELGAAVGRLGPGPIAVEPVLAGEDPVRSNLVGIALAGADQALYVPMGAVGGDPGPGSPLPRELEPVIALLQDPGRVLWGHDLKRLLVTLGARGLAPTEGSAAAPRFDLMLASYLLHAGQGSHGLSDVAMRYLNRLVPPLEAAPPQALADAEMAEKTAERLAVVRSLQPVLTRELDRLGLAELYREVELPLVPVLARMEQTGIKVDCELLGRMSGEMDLEIAAITREIYELAGTEFNINSPKQLGEVLFHRLSLPVLKRTKTGPSTSAEVLEELAAEHPVVARILDYRQLVKLKSTYVDALPQLVNPRTGRVHTSFNQAVTATGRLSSTNPNLQNIPVRFAEGARIREAFVPGEPGWLLMSADYSQIELRVLAHISGDPGLIEAFRADQDIHTRTAAEVFGVPADQVTPQMRSGAKAINFGIVYGISAYGLARGTGLSPKEAQRYIEGYFAKYPGVKAYMERVVEEGRRQGFVQTLFGRRRYLPELHSRQRAQRAFAERMAMNTPIQGSAADIIKKAMVAVDRELRAAGLRARMLLQVHDELVFEVPEDEVEITKRRVREVMEGVVPLEVPLKVDVSAGRNWREAK